MFVHRSTDTVRGNLLEAAALMKEFWERFPPPHVIRIQTSWLFPNSDLTVEHEFASLAEYEEYWSWFRTNPEIAAWLSENRERFVETEDHVQGLWEVMQ